MVQLAHTRHAGACVSVQQGSERQVLTCSSLHGCPRLPLPFPWPDFDDCTAAVGVRKAFLKPSHILDKKIDLILKECCRSIMIFYVLPPRCLGGLLGLAGKTVGQAACLPANACSGGHTPRKPHLDA